MGRFAWSAVPGLILAAGLAAGQERTLTVPPGITVQGVPPIPMSLVEAVAPYGQYRQARLAAWHPTERRMIIATAFGNAPQLHAVAAPGAARTQLTFFPDGVAPRPGAVFEPGGNAVVFQKDSAGGGEANQLFRYDVATARVTLLTDGKSRNGSPVISAGGLVAFDSTRRDGKNRDLYVMSPSEPGQARMIAKTDGAWSALDWSPDGTSILALESVSSSETYLWKIDVASGATIALTPRGGQPVSWSTAAFAGDGRTVYAAGNWTRETAGVWRLSDGTWSPVTPADQIVEGFALAPRAGTMAVVIDLGSTSSLRIFDASGRQTSAPALPPGVITDLAWHQSGREVGLSLAGGRAFNDVYSVDAASGTVARWTASEMGGANPNTLPDAEIVNWKSFDGLSISGVLYRPDPRFTGPRPVIINVHGGPVDRERPRAIGRSNYFRNELGIAVIYPNIRGSAGFGRSFEELDNGPLRENAVKDIGALLDWIAAEPSLDESRVMIAGASYGGYITLAAAVQYGDRLRGANPAFAITDFPSFLESTAVARQANRNAEYGDPADPDMRRFLTRISPLTAAARLKVPVLFAAGARDTRVPIAQAESMVAALEAAGTPVWYVRFEEAGHLQLTAATNDFAIYTWVLFVQRYLLN
jgi:dipeptidyl aminopeptidase/acylaminoacyl peptidase